MSYLKIVEEFGFDPIPEEGGWFKRLYAAPLAEEGRPLCSSIYALFTRSQFSALHRLDADEIFFFHNGDPFEMFELPPGGTGRRVVMGNDLMAGEEAQYVFRKGSWFGGVPKAGGSHGYSLMSCVVAPGFDYAGFEIGKRGELIEDYPDFEDEIKALTRDC